MKKIMRASLCPCPRLRHCKSKGEWAELAFLQKAVGLGFTVCRPYGENHRFDFLVLAGNKANRVQVKSSWVLSNKRYPFKATGSRRYHYRRSDLDFFAVLVVPYDAWYVIPRRNIVPYDVGYLTPHRLSRGRLEKYREAWHLLRGPARRRTPSRRSRRP